MSNRVLKRLNKNKDDLFSLPVESQSESEEEVQTKYNKVAINRFQLLDGSDQSHSDDEPKEDSDKEVETKSKDAPKKPADITQNSNLNADNLNDKKKKKKKKKKNNFQETKPDQEDVEDIDKAIEEINEIFGDKEQILANLLPSAAKKSQKPLLSADFRYLNYTNEVKKIFGNEVLQAEQRRRNRGRTQAKASCLVSPKNWSHLVNNGLKMECVESKDNVYHFNFTHSKQYQTVQESFLKVVERGDPAQIEALIQSYPSNLDLTIQFSEICTLIENFQMAAELIEMTLYVAEMSFHHLFNLTQGNCRMDYKRSTNRSFYIALFKHIILIGQKNYNRTALELCKALLGLDADGDPLGVILMIDWFALKSGEYEFLIQLFNEWDNTKNLAHLPNFAYSVSLALFHQAKTLKDPNDFQKATRMLKQALEMFPEVLVPLLEACKVEVNAKFTSHHIFLPKRKSEYPDALRMLVELYVARAFSLWKEPEIIDWLVSCALEILVSTTEDKIVNWHLIRPSQFKGTSRNILRHIFLSNIKEVTLTLPADIASVVNYSFDPFPPEDSINLYTHTVERRPRDTGILQAFLQSLSPNFNLNQEEPRGEQEEGRGVRAELQRNLTSLLGAMRDLLNNVHEEGDGESEPE